MHAQTFISVDAHIKGQIYEILRKKLYPPCVQQINPINTLED